MIGVDGDDLALRVIADIDAGIDWDTCAAPGAALGEGIGADLGSDFDKPVEIAAALEPIHDTLGNRTRQAEIIDPGPCRLV